MGFKRCSSENRRILLEVSAKLISCIDTQDFEINQNNNLIEKCPDQSSPAPELFSLNRPNLSKHSGILEGVLVEVLSLVPGSVRLNPAASADTKHRYSITIKLALWLQFELVLSMPKLYRWQGSKQLFFCNLSNGKAILNHE